VNDNLARFCQQLGMRTKTIRALQDAHENFARGLAHRVSAASAPAAQTATLILWLPWLAMAATQLLGLRPLNFLLHSWVGLLLLALAGGVSWFASRSTRGHLSHVRAMPPDPGLWRSASAQALKDGVGPLALLSCLEVHCDSPTEKTLVQSCVIESLTTGKPLARTLEKGAVTDRQAVRWQKELELEKLPIRVLSITGGLMLPQFLLLLLIPTVLSALKSFI
jgi:hypothetical protein